MDLRVGPGAPLNDLMDRAFALHRRAMGLKDGCVVTPSVPILWFGDLDAYQRSQLRVITVGLNPSLKEFPADDPFQRFSLAASIDGLRGAYDYRAYRRALAAYFEESPYATWFNAFEPILNGMGASYYAGRTSTAVHTDICSPVATDPTWSGLSPSAKEALIADGRELWHDLVRLLRPDVILISVAKEHIEGITFPFLEDWQVVQPAAAGANAKATVRGRRLAIDDGHTALLVSGTAYTTPFSYLKKERKVALGTAVAELAQPRTPGARQTLYIDMDNVLVDFPSGIARLPEWAQVEFEDRYDDAPGIFSLMEPKPGAVEAFHRLSAVFDTYILSTAPWDNPGAWRDKLLWVKRHLGDGPDSPAYKRLILSHHKNLNRGDFIVDDRTARGVDEFEGEHIHFDTDRFPDWETVTAYLLERAGGPMATDQPAVVADDRDGGR